MALEWPQTLALRFLLTGADTLHQYPPPTLPFALINNYGPTEATVVATSGRISPVEHPDSPPDIGRPITNAQVYILDERLQQVAPGETGELYLGGAGLARGYLNRPELTAERFIEDPFSNEPEARLYKTGDLARFQPDGTISFLGRADQQIKIRGYRIEPDEIVSVLNRHHAIQASLVIAREDTPGEKRLVAYLVPVAGIPITASALQEHISAYLPDYMLPSAFAPLEAFPLTPNGKIDRAALPLPDENSVLRQGVESVPETPVQARIAGIVAALLKMERVGIDDNFFMLGGHSMMGAQLILEITATFGVELSLRSLFEHPTVRQLSEQVTHLLIAKLEGMSDEEAASLL
jgi:acyl carrier protein